METSWEDLIVWPDDTYCFRTDLSSYLNFMSDDYEVFYFGTNEYDRRLADYGLV